MSEDFFGYKRNINAKEILSSDFALIGVKGSDTMGLVQGAQMSYQQRVEPRFEAGSSDLYWVNGQPSGQMRIDRLVGKSGIFHNVSRNGCGELQTISMLEMVTIVLFSMELFFRMYLLTLIHKV